MWEVKNKEVREGGLTVVTLPNRSMAALGKFRYEEVAKQDAERLRLVAAAPELLEAATEALAYLNMIAMRYADTPGAREYQEIAAARTKLCTAVSLAEGRVIGGSIPDMNAVAELLRQKG